MFDEDWFDLIEEAYVAAEAAHQRALIKEARAIVAGVTNAAPRSEHLLALLDWIDGHCPAPLALKPDEDLPF